MDEYRGLDKFNEALEIEIQNWSIGPKQSQVIGMPMVELLDDGNLTVTWYQMERGGKKVETYIQIIPRSDTVASSADKFSLLDTALQTINSQRAELGSLSNRLDHIIANNTNASTNTKASLGRIQDADFAAETTKLAKSKILEQSSTAMLAQANASVYEVLTLIPD